jgi:hypothetical protein
MPIPCFVAVITAPEYLFLGVFIYLNEIDSMLANPRITLAILLLIYTLLLHVLLSFHYDT